MTAERCAWLTAYFQRRERRLTRVGLRAYAALFGYVRVCMDIYGPEVKVGYLPWLGMLDCSPWDYDLTKEQALGLYDAILGCVPGTTDWEAKREQLRKIS